MSKTKRRSSEKISDLQKICQLSIRKFCSKRLLEIYFMEPLTSYDSQFLNDIVATGKEYDNISGVYFITYQDVQDLTARLTLPDADVSLPDHVKESAQKLVLTEFQKPSISLEFLALMTKIKIIELLYAVYTAEVNKMERRNKVQQELNELLKNCEVNSKKGKSAKPEKGDKPAKKSTSRISGKQVSVPQIAVADYTDIQLEENETIFDYNIENHSHYVVLCDFPYPSILQYLIKHGVPVSVILDVSSDSSDENFSEIILQLEQLFDAPAQASYLENTIWMKYRGNPSEMKETFEELLYVIKRISYIKRQHLSYIKNLKLCNLGANPQKVFPGCMEKYRRILNSYPTQLINVPLIVNALIQEVSWRGLGSIHSLSDLSSSSKSKENTPRERKSYQAHEEDFLKMGMYAFGEPGRQCYEHSLEYLRQVQPLRQMHSPSTTRLVNRAVSTEESCYCSDPTELFDLLHLAMFNQMKTTEFVPTTTETYGFIENLVTYDQSKAYKKILPENSSSSSGEENTDVLNTYHMKEDLSTAVLLQLIFKAMTEYSCWDRCYCEQSKAVLLRFHDNLNQFGIDTKIWDQNLRTPVCLRDFCRFVTNDDKQWIQENKVIDYGDLNQTGCEEECKGLVDLHVPELYQEYQYLLGAGTCISSDNKKEVFDGIIKELLTCPGSGDLVKLCDPKGTLLAYDLGPIQCQLTGHTTIFHSNDGVKLIVDTTRFMVEPPKCTINVESDGNSLVFHKHRPSAFHFILEDGTFVSFSEFEDDQSVAAEPPILLHEEVQNEAESVSEEEEKEEEEKMEGRIPNYNDYWIQVLRKNKTGALPVLLNQSISNKRIKLDDQNLDRLLELFKAAVYIQDPIYKISTRPSVRRLRRITSPVHIPLVRTLNRMLFKPKRKKRIIGGYSVLNIPANTEKVAFKYDFKIILPNGLLITTIPRNRSLAEVKQQYKYSSYKEQYRVFYTNGLVVIKNVNGTTTVYRSNGDIIELSNNSGSVSVDCTKTTKQIFLQKGEEEVCPYQLSRCTDFLKVKGRMHNINFYEFDGVPYLKKTFLEFEGRRIDVSGNKVTEKQQYYVINENDYHAEEVFFEREDGMKCIVHKKGEHVYQFPDGTKITSWPEVEKELIYISRKVQSEGWVSIVINYTYEHPDYVTVKYEPTKGLSQLVLKDSTIRNYQDSFHLSAMTNIALEVTSSNITFSKKCEKCDGNCTTEIHLNETFNLLEMHDSYNKHLSCDPFGKCTINSDYITTQTNKYECNHVWRNEKQKFFILNERGPAGSILWKDYFIEHKIIQSKNSKSIKTSNYLNKLTRKQTIEFFTEIHQNFRGRFTRTQKQRDICLSKHKTANLNEKKTVLYVTYRILIEFQNLAEQPERITDLEKYVENQVDDPSTRLMLKGIKQLIVRLFESENEKQDKPSYQVDMLEREDSVAGSSISQSFDLDKPTVEEIISKWRKKCEDYRYLIRNRKFPPYFHSDYYQFVMRRSKERKQFIASTTSK